MNDKASLKSGIVGTVVAALCCFTPILVIGMGAVGLSAWIGGVDYVVFPVMFASMGLIANSLYVRAGKAGPRPLWLIGVTVVAFSALLLWLEFRYALRITVAAAVSVGVYAWYLRSSSARVLNVASDTDKQEQQS